MENTNLKQIVGQEQNDIIKKNIIFGRKTIIFKSTLFRKDDLENPIYLQHQNMVELNDDIETEIINLCLDGEEDEYVVGDYMWVPINYSDITFTDLIPITNLGDCYFITNDGTFELENVEVDSDTNLMFYSEAILRN